MDNLVNEGLTEGAVIVTMNNEQSKPWLEYSENGRKHH